MKKIMPIRFIFTVLLTALIAVSANALPVHAAGDVEGGVVIIADDDYGDKEIEFGNITAEGGDALYLTVKDSENHRQ